MSHIGMTELIFVDTGVKVNGQYCNVLLSQQMCPAMKHAAERCLFTKQYVAYGKIGHFCVLWFPKVKVVALDRWGGKWNHLSMTHTLTTDYAKNYCNRTLIVTVIIENVVTCFLGHSVLGHIPANSDHHDTNSVDEGGALSHSVTRNDTAWPWSEIRFD